MTDKSNTEKDFVLTRLESQLQFLQRELEELEGQEKLIFYLLENQAREAKDRLSKLPLWATEYQSIESEKAQLKSLIASLEGEKRNFMERFRKEGAQLKLQILKLQEDISAFEGA